MFRPQKEEQECSEGRRYRTSNKNGGIYSKVLTANGLKKEGEGVEGVGDEWGLNLEHSNLTFQ